MKVILKIFNISIIGILYNTVSFFFRFLSLKNDIGAVLYSDLFKSILSNYLEVPEIKKDWLGRLYCIVNPNLNDRGQFDMNKIIYELDSNGLQVSNQMYVENWLVNKLRIIQDLFKQRALFSKLSFTTQHVGPINHDNFLIVIEPRYTADVLFWWGKLRVRLIIYSVLAALSILVINIC